MLNIMAVVIATLASFVVGWMWYSPMMFGKMWMKENGMTEADMKKDKHMSSGVSLELLGTVIMVYVLAYFIMMLKVADVGNAIMLAFWFWFGFKMPEVLSKIAWEKKSWNAMILHGGHSLVSMAVASVILTMWR